MAKSKKRRKSKKAAQLNWGGQASPDTGRFNLILGVISAAAIIAGGVYWWQGRAVNTEFMALAGRGQAALEQVENFPNLGRTHLRPGETRGYATSTPTSGDHDPFPITPGYYSSMQPPTRLVHSLEHGNIVLYYDRPPPETMELIKSWASLYSDLWDGIVIAPLSGLGTKIIATAWRKKLELETFDPAAFAAFVDAYRGRGPENPVR